MNSRYNDVKEHDGPRRPPEPKLPPWFRKHSKSATPGGEQSRKVLDDGLDSLSIADLARIVRDRAVLVPSGANRDTIIAAIRALPPPIESRSMYAGKRIVRAREYQGGGNPRQPGSHGHNAYELIPLGDHGIRFEDLIARIRLLPAKSSPTYGAGGTNHIKWDLDHGYTYLIDAGDVLASDATGAHRPFDSSKTRVIPVFDAISAAGSDWVRTLLRLPQGTAAQASIPSGLRLETEECCWGSRERALDPPVSLLSWLIRNLPVSPKRGDNSEAAERRWRLAAGDPDAIAEALHLLRSDPSNRGWHILEGQTYPDVFIETPDALIVIEGKRTESGPTTSTTWMPGRHQMLRHIDAAWEIRGRRRVFGFFIVEGDEGSTAVPERWMEAARETISMKAVATSLPHRSPDEQEGIINAFLGVTTWQAVCEEFGIDTAQLPDLVPAMCT